MAARKPTARPSITRTIHAGPSGIDYGTFTGANEAEVLDAYAQEQGYADFAALADALELTVEQARGDLELVEVEPEEGHCYAIVNDITPKRATVVQRFTDRREAMRAWEELGRWFDHALVHDPRGFDAGERVWLRSVQRLRGRAQRAG